MASLFAEVKIFRFWPKTMDYIYNKVFWPKLSSFFVVLLLLTGRCYEAKICTILLLLRYSFRWYHILPRSKFSVFDQKPWTIIHGFIFESPKKVLRKVYRFKGNENRSLTVLVSVA